MRPFTRVLCLAAAFVFVAPSALAQVGSALVAVPWQPGKTVGGEVYGLGMSTESEGAGFDVDLTRVATFGRVRLDSTNPNGVSFGWLHDHIDLSTDDPLLPERLVASAAAVGFGLGEYDGWSLGGSVGLGYAGDKPFADEDAWYGLASVYARKPISEKEFLTILIDYDGSRAFLPDLPIPGFQYSVVESRSLRYSLGLPFSSLYYEPDDHWVLDLQYAIPLGGRATVEYRFNEQWRAFATYSSSTRGYHLDGDNENRRLFFSQERAELGVHYDVAEGVRLTAAGGWAFEQEFTRGWDTRDDDDVRELDDAAYVRLGLTFAF